MITSSSLFFLESARTLNWFCRGAMAPFGSPFGEKPLLSQQEEHNLGPKAIWEVLNFVGDKETSTALTCSLQVIVARTTELSLCPCAQQHVDT